MATKKNEAAPTAAEPINETAEVMPESGKKSGKKKIYIRKPAGVINDKGKIVGLNGKMYSVPYDKEVEVYFHKRIRDEKDFDNADALLEQIHTDAEIAKELHREIHFSAEDAL